MGDPLKSRDLAGAALTRSRPKSWFILTPRRRAISAAWKIAANCQQISAPNSVPPRSDASAKDCEEDHFPWELDLSSS